MSETGNGLIFKTVDRYDQPCELGVFPCAEPGYGGCLTFKVLGMDDGVILPFNAYTCRDTARYIRQLASDETEGGLTFIYTFDGGNTAQIMLSRWFYEDKLDGFEFILQVNNEEPIYGPLLRVGNVKQLLVMALNVLASEASVQAAPGDGFQADH